MTEDYYATRAVRTGPSLKGMLLAGLLSFAGGAGLVGYLAWNGQLQIGPEASSPQPATSPTPTASASPTAAVDQQVAALEQRLARLDLQAAAFDGSSARAEGLLVALATRRAIEQGKPLGYLEGQLQTRFNQAAPEAVKVVITAARSPVTLEMLAAELDSISPALLGKSDQESAWDSFWRTVSNLFVIRRDDGSARPGEARLDHARLLLRSGMIDQAIAELAQLPGSGVAKDWVARAQSYAATQAALAKIEEAALTEPRELKDGDGDPIVQPGLPATPTPSPIAAPSPTP